MIELTRINGTLIFVNPDQILFAEETPDTIITLTNGEKLLVKESNEELRQRYIDLKRHIAREGFEVIS